MIIVLTGEKQHGKDTFAEAIKDTHQGLLFSRRAFADSMKDLTAVLLDCEYEEIEDLKTKEAVLITDKGVIRQGTNMRRFLQTLGQTMKDLTGNKEIWCQLLAKTMKDPLANYIVTDCRFPFEAAYMERLANMYNHKFVVVKVFNPRVESGKDAHVSERSMVGYKTDVIIVNDGTIKDLESHAVTLIKDLEGGKYV